MEDNFRAGMSPAEALKETLFLIVAGLACAALAALVLTQLLPAGPSVGPVRAFRCMAFPEPTFSRIPSPAFC